MLYVVLVILIFVNWTQNILDWEKGISVEEFPLSD